MSAYPTNANRICDYQDRLKAGTSTLKPIEFERLMDDYRAEQHRYDHLDRELQELEEPNKYLSKLERSNKLNRESIKY